MAICKLPTEVMGPLHKWMNENDIHTRGQAWTILGIEYLREKGLLSDEYYNNIKARTIIFQTHTEAVEKKMILFRKIIERKETIEVYIPSSDVKYLKQIQATLQTLPYEKYVDYVGGYRKKAEECMPHPLARNILKLLDEVEE